MSQSLQSINFDPIKTGLNHDDELKYLPLGDGLWRFNCRYGIANDNVGVIENTKGNEKIDVVLPSGTNKTIGSTTNPNTKSIIYFIYNSNSNHCILNFNTETNVITFLQQNNSALNFSTDRLINHAGVVGELLFWTESFARDFDIDNNDNNPPREININKALTHTYTAMEMEVIKRPPISIVECSYGYDSTKKINALKNKVYQFAIRYIYDNNEHSVLGMYSEIVPAILEDGLADTGEIGYNYINLKHKVEYNNVSQVEFYVRSGNEQGFWKFYEKKVSPLYLETISYNFYNSESKMPISDDELRIADAVPQKSSTLEVLEKNRIVFGDNVEGYDNVDLDVKMTSFYEAVNLTETPIPVTITGGTAGTNPQYSYYKIPINSYDWVVGDVLQLKLGAWCSSVQEAKITYRITQNDLDNWLVFQNNVIAIINSTNVPTNYNYNDYCSATTPTQSKFLALRADEVGLYSNEWIALITNKSYISGSSAYWNIPIGEVTLYNVKKISKKSHLKGAEHRYGIVYYDEQMRPGAVNINDDTSFYIDARYFENEGDVDLSNGQTYLSHGMFHIKHTPPDWAYWYAPVRTKRSTTQSFMQIVLGATPTDSGDNKKVDVFTEIDNSATQYIKTKLGAYSFKPNDRIRFLYTTDASGNIYPFPKVIDVEILGTEASTTVVEKVTMRETDFLGNVKTTIDTTTTVTLEGKTTVTPSQQILGSLTSPVYRTTIDDPIVTSTNGTSLIVENFDLTDVGRSDVSIDGKTLAEVYSPKNTFTENKEPYYEVGVINTCRGIGGELLHFGGIKLQGTNLTINTPVLSLGGILQYIWLDNISLTNKAYLSTLKIGDTIKVYDSSAGVYIDVTIDSYSNGNPSYLGVTIPFLSGVVSSSINILLYIPSTTDYTLLPLYSGDVYVRSRQASANKISTTEDLNNYVVESYNYSDYFESDVHDYGRPNIVNPFAKRLRMQAALRYGGQILLDTQINNLNKFDGLDLVELPTKFGSINALREVGFSLKAIMDMKTITIFVGRQSTSEADGSSNLILTDKVLGAINIPNVDWGSIHPESCIVHNRWLYFADAINGAIVRDSANGMYPISDYKMNNFFKQMLKENYDSKIISGIDAEYNEVVFNFTHGIDKSTKYVTISFDEKSNRWKSFWDYKPEKFAYLGNKYISFVDGNLWLHNTNALYTNFYGIQRYQEVDIYGNPLPTKVKSFQNVALETNINFNLHSDNWSIPQITVPLNEGEMSSRLKSNKFIRKEGRYYADLLRDINTPGMATSSEVLFNGRPLRGEVIKLSLFNKYDIYANLIKVGVGVNISELSF